jgi:S1-C subfamily serine protease
VCSPVFDDFVRTQLGDGVMVFKVGKDSVGQRIGLERHDLIKSVNGDEVTNVEDLQTALENAGDKLTIEVVRKGKPVTLQEK